MSGEREISLKWFRYVELPMGTDGEKDIPDDGSPAEEGGVLERDGTLPFVGVVLYGATSGLVSFVVLVDYVINFAIYSKSYLMGAPFFIALNLLVTAAFTREALRGRYRWPVMVAPVVPYVMIFWLYHGLSALGSTVTLAVMGVLGLGLVWYSWSCHTRV